MLLAKAVQLLHDQGAAAAREFAVSIATVGNVESALAVVQMLGGKGHQTEMLLGLAAICKEHPDRIDLAETFGKSVRGSVGCVGPAIDADGRCVSPSDCAFISFVGGSYVRVFASGTRFLPIFIANGPDITCLTPALAEGTRRRYLSNIARVDPQSLLLITAGNPDAWHHVRDTKGTRSAVERRELVSHEQVIRAAARHFFDMIDEVIASGRRHVAILSAMPMIKVEVNELIKIYNAELRAFTIARQIPLLDLTDALTDPVTGCLRAEFSVGDDDNHVSHAAVPLVEDALARQGLLPDTYPAFEWEYLFRFTLPETETRFWGEPYGGARNVTQSHKVMFSQIMGRALNIFVGCLAAYPGSTAIIVNGREGFLATGIPLGISARTISFDANESAIVMGRRVARFAGRSDLTFRTVDGIASCADDVPETDVAFVTIHEADDIEACVLAAQRLLSKIRRRILILTAADIGARLAALSGVSSSSSVILANRLTTGFWAGARLISLVR